MFIEMHDKEKGILNIKNISCLYIDEGNPILLHATMMRGADQTFHYDSEGHLMDAYISIREAMLNFDFQEELV